MPSQRRARIRAAIPNWFTVGNAICGFSAILCAAHSLFPNSSHATDVLLSVMFIALAMVFDALDGRLARLFGSTSDLGAQLDSLSDAVSFGLAPAFLMFQICGLFAYLPLLWLVGALYLGCAVMRLGRFNVETADHSEESHSWFTGLPSPAAAFVVCLGALVFSSAGYIASIAGFDTAAVERTVAFAIVASAAAAAWLMVSRLRVPHLNQLLRMVRGAK